MGAVRAAIQRARRYLGLYGRTAPALVQKRVRAAQKWTGLSLLPDTFRVARGTCQAMLLWSIYYHSEGGPSYWELPGDGYTPPMLPTDFSREGGFTQQQMREEIADALADKPRRGPLIERIQDPATGAYRYRNLREKWAAMPNAGSLEVVRKPVASEEEPNTREATGSRDTVRLVRAPLTVRCGGHSRSVRIVDQVKALRLVRNDLDSDVSMDAVIQAGEVQISLFPPARNEAKPVPKRDEQQAKSREATGSRDWRGDPGYRPFVDAYLKTGKPLIDEDFAEAFPLWKALRSADRVTALRGIEQRLDFKLWDDPVFVPAPKRYLKGEWARKVVPPRKKPGRMTEDDQVSAIEEFAG